MIFLLPVIPFLIEIREEEDEDEENLRGEGYRDLEDDKSLITTRSATSAITMDSAAPKHKKEKTFKSLCVSLFETVQLRAVYQPMAFVYIFNAMQLSQVP